MANLGDLSINLSLTPGEETVRRCLQILDMYLTDNPNMTLEVNEFRGPDGTIRRVWLKNSNDGTGYMNI